MVFSLFFLYYFTTTLENSTFLQHVRHINDCSKRISWLVVKHEANLCIEQFHQSNYENMAKNIKFSTEDQRIYHVKFVNILDGKE